MDLFTATFIIDVLTLALWGGIIYAAYRIINHAIDLAMADSPPPSVHPLPPEVGPIEALERARTAEPLEKPEGPPNRIVREGHQPLPLPKPASLSVHTPGGGIIDV